MKIQIDTTNKVIRVEEKINLNEFYKAIQKLLSNGEWKDFELDTNTTINWQSPIIIKEKEWAPITINPSPYTNPFPVPQPWYTTCGTTISDGGSRKQLLQDGIFNVEC